MQPPGVSSDWTPSVRTQDYGFTDPAIFGNGVFPDNRENPEWWGIVSVQKSPTGGVDTVQPRQTYYTLQQKFGLFSAADLTLTALSTSVVSVSPGKSFPLSNTARNQGSAAVNNPFIIDFHLSSDAVYGGTDDIAFTTVRSISSLAAGTNNSGTTTLIVPSTTPNGNYYICAKVDAGNAVLEENETNQTRCASSAINVSPSDLAMTALSAPATALTGTAITVNNTITNLVTINSPGVYTGFFLSPDAVITTADTWLGYRYISSITAGASASGVNAFTIPSTLLPGTYYIGAIVDYPNYLAELNEANNVLTGNSIVIGPGADFVMTSVSGPSSSVRGTLVTVANTAANQGSGNGAGFTVGIYLSTDATITTADRLVGSRFVGTLLPGGSSSANTGFTIPTNLSPGTYYWGAIADYNNTRPEQNETNNAKTGNAVVIQ